MYTIRVEAIFSATHNIRLPDGMEEPSHGHDWRVSAFFSSRELDDLGMVVGFEEAQAAVRCVLDPLRHVDLNQIGSFAGLNPTAEVVARYLFAEIGKALPNMIRRVEVEEAPGCVAMYEE